MNKYLKYIQIPFKEKGRDFDGCDCWGLVRLILRHEQGVDLPSLTTAYENTKDSEAIQEEINAQRLRTEWKEIPLEEISEGDVLLFRHTKFVSHIGYVVDRYNMIHIETGCGVAIERWYKTIRWEKRLFKAYRHVR